MRPPARCSRPWLSQWPSPERSRLRSGKAPGTDAASWVSVPADPPAAPSERTAAPSRVTNAGRRDQADHGRWAGLGDRGRSARGGCEGGGLIGEAGGGGAFGPTVTDALGAHEDQGEQKVAKVAHGRPGGIAQ